MTDALEALESTPGDVATARDKIEATRDALQLLLDTQEGDLAPFRQAVARLDRIAAELSRVEEAIAEQLGAVAVA